MDYKKKKKRKKRRRIILVIVLAMLGGGWFFGNRFAKQKGHDGLWSLLTSSASNYSSSIPADIKISIEIDEVEFAKLKKVREDALERGVIIQPDDPYVPCKINYEGEKIKAEIRLKGKMTDHVEGKKWSFRVKTKKNDALMGMQRFTLQHPGTRSYIHEWVYHEISGREGIVRLRYKFINLTLNGENLGVYALEEHFGQEVLGNNQRDEGPIFRFNPSLYWYYRLNELNKIEIVEEYTRFQNSQIEPFTQAEVMKDSSLKADFGEAIVLMEQFRQGKVPAKEVLDVEKFARRHAILDLIGGYHSVDWSDVKFYYNPDSKLIEPVAYESFSARKVKELIGHYRFTGHEGYTDDFHERLFNDADYFRAYMQNLERLGTKSYMDTFFNQTDSALNHNLNILYGEFPFKDFTKEVYYYNQDIIRRSLDSPQAFHAYFNATTDSTLQLQVGSIESLPAEIHAVSIDGKRFELPKKIIVPAKKNGAYVKYNKHTINLNLPDSLSGGRKMELHYTMLGLQKESKVEVMPRSFPEPDRLVQSYEWTNESYTNFPFWEVDFMNRELIFKEGTWTLDKNLEIPEGWTVKGFGSISLNFINGAKLISSSPITFKGNEATPIQITASGSEGSAIALKFVQGNSVFEHVQFSQFKNGIPAAFGYDAVVHIYESNVEFNDCVFYDNTLKNVVKANRSEVKLRNTVFSKTSNDALRLHYCDSRMNNVRFKNIGDQATVVVGGELRFSDVQMDSVRDKGLTVQEEALCSGNNLSIRNAKRGIDVKDAASFTVTTLSLSGLKTGIKVHKKGDVFGPASAKIKGMTTKDVGQLYDIEKGSKVFLDGKEVPSPTPVQ